MKTKVIATMILIRMTIMLIGYVTKDGEHPNERYVRMYIRLESCDCHIIFMTQPYLYLCYDFHDRTLRLFFT
jgi:hypothetical protein